jgi:hypothetical protein
MVMVWDMLVPNLDMSRYPRTYEGRGACVIHACELLPDASILGVLPGGHSRVNTKADSEAGKSSHRGLSPEKESLCVQGQKTYKLWQRGHIPIQSRAAMRQTPQHPPTRQS